MSLRDPRPSTPHTGKPRVAIRAPTKADAREFVERMKASRAFHAMRAKPPSTPTAFQGYLRRSRDPRFAAFLVCRTSDSAIVGVINLSQIERHAYQNAHLGYYVVGEFSGQGYMTEGLSLVLKRAFTTMRLHRLEANIMPKNKPSQRLVERCGLRQEGLAKRMIRIAGSWQDHQRWAITVEDWCKRSR